MNVQGHQASVDDIGALYDAVKVFHKLGFASLKDELYIADILNTIILIDTFSNGFACDSLISPADLAKRFTSKT